jgi:hypothetical protein
MSKNQKAENSPKCKISLRKIASIHEAGHAIVYHMYGHNISSIKIDSDGNGFISCVIHTPTSGIYDFEGSDVYKRLEIYGMICLSGFCAEFKFQNIRIGGMFTIKNSDSKVSQNNDVADLRKEMEKINEIKHENICNDMYFYLIQEDTKKLIRKRNIWNGIINLSEEMMNSKNNYLEGEKVHEILNKYVKHGSKK